MFKVSVFLLCVFFSTVSSVAMKWTDDYWRGKGVEVDNAYLQSDKKSRVRSRARSRTLP